MGRCVYEGIYDPKSAHADERGLRTDVLGALRDQKLHDRALSRRQLPQRLQLARRRRPQGASARAAASWPGNR
jgi:hypothetical protein